MTRVGLRTSFAAAA